jgi:hypothetical protein
MKRCEWCETFAALYNSNRRCCQVRLIGLMPPKRRAQAIDKIAREKGRDVADVADRLAREELDRWRAYRAAQAANAA